MGKNIDEKSLLTLRIITKEQGKFIPTIGGILLFGKTRTDIFPDCYIQYGRFIGEDKSQIFDNVNIDEPLPMAVESVLSFLKKHAIKRAEFISVRRKDIWPIPIIALREAVINAIVHADYS